MLLVALEGWQRWSISAGTLVVAVAAALIIHYLLFRFLTRVSKGISVLPECTLTKRFGEPARWVMICVGVRLALPFLGAPEKLANTIAHILTLLLIATISWLLIKATYVLQDCVVNRFSIEEKDNLRARKIYNQLNVLKRIVIVVVSVLALGMMLMTFPRVRQLGTTILASAGIIGIIIGMAAQRTIGTFIAGLQIAFTQPIRVDDVVIVENEWGRIEEITLTYVVVKIWDLRRLIVPITYFIEKPFQNWTRTTADILGTVFIYVDYTVPVEVIREELSRLLKDSELWDGKVCVLQVTNASERTVELRALVSASDASKAWSLRCEVREKLIDFIRKNYSDVLPKLRAEFHQLKDR